LQLARDTWPPVAIRKEVHASDDASAVDRERIDSR